MKLPTYTIRNAAILGNAIQFAQATWEAMSQTKHPLVIEFKPESTKRSIQALKYHWAVLRQIEEQAWLEGKQYSAEIWNEYAKRKFIGCIDLPGGGAMGMSSENFTTEEYAEYTTKLEVWAQQELGVCLVDMAEPPARYRGVA